MTIDQKVNAFLQSKVVGSRTWKNITQWAWRGLPRSQEIPSRPFIHVYSEVDRMIRDSNPAECLTSAHDYIRKTSEWYARHRKENSNG